MKKILHRINSYEIKVLIGIGIILGVFFGLSFGMAVGLVFGLSFIIIVTIMEISFEKQETK
jgi:uncharacterized protein (DUF58 family)